MQRAKLLAMAAVIAFASVTFASKAFAGVTGIIIYLGQYPYPGDYPGDPHYNYCPYPYYSYGYYPGYAYGYGPYRRGHWRRHPLK